MKKFGKRESIDPNDSNIESKKTFKELRNILINKGSNNTFSDHGKKDTQSIEVDKDLPPTDIKCLYDKINDILLFVYKKFLDVVEKERLENFPFCFFECVNHFGDKSVLETIEFLSRHKYIFKFADACYLCNLKLKYKKNQSYISLCIKVFCLMSLIEEITTSLQKINSKLYELSNEMYLRYAFLLKSFVEDRNFTELSVDSKESLCPTSNIHSSSYFDLNSSIVSRIKIDQQFIKEMIESIKRIMLQEDSIRNLICSYIHDLCASNPSLRVNLQSNFEKEKIKYDSEQILRNIRDSRKFKTPENSFLLDYSDSSDENDILSLSRNKKISSKFIDECSNRNYMIEENSLDSFEKNRSNYNCFGNTQQEYEGRGKELYEGTPVKKMCIRKYKTNLCLPKFKSSYQLQEMSYPKTLATNNFDQVIDKKKDGLNNYNKQKAEEVSKVKFSNDEIVSKIYVSKERMNCVMFQDHLVRTEQFDYSSNVYSIEEIYEILRIKHIKFTDLPQNVVKVSEASFSEVFKYGTDIYKIIPLGTNYTQEYEFLQEAFIQFSLSNEDGICKLKDICMVEGKYTQSYLDSWDKFGFIENERPSKYSCRQKYGVLIMENGGESLEEYKFKTVKEIVLFIKEVIRHLSELEIRYEFEHRDLHWGNILIKNMKISIIDFTLARIKNKKIIFNDLSQKQWLFEGDPNIDEQFLVYREMRDASKGDWFEFNPITNVLWLRYIINKSFSKIKTPKSEKFRKIFLEVVNKCNSVVEVQKNVKF